jgi:hypothetical protein
MLRSSFGALAGADAERLLIESGIAPTARAEEIPVSAFRALAGAWRVATTAS